MARPVSPATIAASMADPATVSLKRAAWAYGCALKGSDEERRLLGLLWRVAERELVAAQRTPHFAADGTLRHFCSRESCPDAQEADG